MKTKFLFLYIILFIISSCDRDYERMGTDGCRTGTEMYFHVPAFSKASHSKSTISKGGVFTWSTGDRIGIMNYDVNSSTCGSNHLAQTISPSEDENIAFSKTIGWTLIPGGSYKYIAYYPYAEDNSGGVVKIDYSGQCQTANSSTSHLGVYDFMYSNPSIPESEGEADFTFNHIGSLANIKVSVPDEYKDSTFYQLSLCSESEIFTTSATYSIGDIVEQGYPSFSKSTSFILYLSFGGEGIKPEEGVIDAWILMLPSELSGKTVSVKLYAEKNNVPTLSGTFTPDDNQLSGESYEYTATSAPTGAVLPDKPLEGSGFNILLFGHSFGVDGLQYLYKFASEAGLSNINIGLCAEANCSLAKHWQHVIDKDTYGFSLSSTETMSWSSSSNSIDYALNYYPWDIIIFQQCIGFEGEGDYDSYQPELNELIEYVTDFCENAHGKTPVIGWHMFWGFNSDHSVVSDIDSHEMYEAIVSATEEMVEDIGIRLIIPSGTGMENARGTSLNSDISASQLFLRDGYHASVGMGRYVAAATWYQRIFAPIFGKDVSGIDISGMDYSFSYDQVTAEKAAILKKCAIEAVNHPYEVTPIAE